MLASTFTNYTIGINLPMQIFPLFKSQQNLLLIEYQRVKYFEKCNC